MPRFFDSHCHLDFDVFDEDREQVVERAAAAGVCDIVVPGVEPRQWAQLVGWSLPAIALHVAVGTHPYWVPPSRELESDWEKELERLPSWCERARAVAVGECGLDGLHAKRGGASLERQTAVLERNLAVASELGLPVILHVVRAHGAVLGVLRRFRLPRGGVVHAYSGSRELVSEYVALGFFFGIGGAVTRERARKLQGAVQTIPEERLLLETDAPDQAPAGWTKRNEPRTIERIATTVAQLRGVSVERVAERTEANARALFGLP